MFIVMDCDGYMHPSMGGASFVVHKASVYFLAVERIRILLLHPALLAYGNVKELIHTLLHNCFLGISNLEFEIFRCERILVYS